MTAADPGHRRFTLLDAMTLVAATGVGLGLSRVLYSGLLPQTRNPRLTVVQLAVVWTWMLAPCVALQAVALTARVLLTLQQHAGGYLLPQTLGLGVGVVAAVTVTFGNLAAFGQTNLKRLLAYSTIAHAGYMLLAVAVVTPQAASAVLFYLVAYLLMNLGAFAVVALVRNATG